MNDDCFIPEEDLLTAEFADYAVRLAGGGPGGLRDIAHGGVSDIESVHLKVRRDGCRAGIDNGTVR